MSDIMCQFSSGKRGEQCTYCGYKIKMNLPSPPRRICDNQDLTEEQMVSAEKTQNPNKKGIFTKIAQFANELTKWKSNGGKYRKQSQIEEIFSVCSSNACKSYIDHGDGTGECGICGCNLKPTKEFMNKIAWDTTSCPHEPPYWGPEGVLVELNTEIPEKQNSPEEVSEEPKNDPPKKGGCGCGR